MARKKRWELSPIVNGIGEVRLLSWRYFLDYIYQEMLDYEHYIWRGHRCDNWILESTLDRLVKKAKIAKAKSHAFRRAHLEQFKYSIRGRRGQNPAPVNAENEWWALGQHHGLATPLLDWTASPFVAAYFAFIGSGNSQTKFRAVYALGRPAIENKVNQLMRTEKQERENQKREMAEGRRKPGLLDQAFLDATEVRPEVEFIRPRSDENQRLVNQNGLFTRAPDEMSMEQWVAMNFRDEKRSYIMIKILVPNKDREYCLRTLNRMNINHLTLFPDLYGASKYCNLFGEIKNY